MLCVEVRCTIIIMNYEVVVCSYYYYGGGLRAAGLSASFRPKHPYSYVLSYLLFLSPYLKNTGCTQRITINRSRMSHPMTSTTLKFIHVVCYHEYRSLIILHRTWMWRWMDKHLHTACILHHYQIILATVHILLIQES